MVTTQPTGWVDTRYTNFHAVHQYIPTNTDIGVGWGALLDAVALPKAEGQERPRTASVAAALGKSEYWRNQKHRKVQVDWETSELYVRSNLP